MMKMKTCSVAAVLSLAALLCPVLAVIPAHDATTDCFGQTITGATYAVPNDQLFEVFHGTQTQLADPAQLGDDETYGTNPFWVSPHTSNALAAALQGLDIILFKANGLKDDGAPEQKIYLYKYGLTTNNNFLNIQDVSGLPGSETALFTWMVDGNTPNADTSTFGRPSDEPVLHAGDSTVAERLTAACGVSQNRAYWGWRRPFDQDEFALCQDTKTTLVKLAVYECDAFKVTSFVGQKVIAYRNAHDNDINGWNQYAQEEFESMEDEAAEMMEGDHYISPKKFIETGGTYHGNIDFSYQIGNYVRTHRTNDIELFGSVTLRNLIDAGACALSGSEGACPDGKECKRCELTAAPSASPSPTPSPSPAKIVRKKKVKRGTTRPNRFCPTSGPTLLAGDWISGVSMVKRKVLKPKKSTDWVRTVVTVDCEHGIMSLQPVVSQTFQGSPESWFKVTQVTETCDHAPDSSRLTNDRKVKCFTITGKRVDDTRQTPKLHTFRIIPHKTKVAHWSAFKTKVASGGTTVEETKERDTKATESDEFRFPARLRAKDVIRTIDRQRSKQGVLSKSEN